MKLRRIITKETEPTNNIAVEHALHHIVADTKQDAILRFWKNDPCVVIGRVQDITKEVNLPYCKDHDIKVLRRISGGGTVFHDHGNLNTSIILPVSRFPEKNVQAMSRYIARLMTETLDELGISPVYQEGDTNIFYQDKKISGSAGHLRKGWFLHHATLLFDTNLEQLNNSILARESNPDDPKESRYFETVNLTQITISQWIDAFSEKIVDTFDLALEESELSNKEVRYGEKLVDELYQNREWIYHGKRKLVKP